jgi:DNA-binding GntR family transcriptional regulator
MPARLHDADGAASHSLVEAMLSQRLAPGERLGEQARSGL